MHVLMLGWEFPPFITGGLGTACHGLTRALDQRGVRVTFVLPRSVDQEHAAHVALVSPEAPLSTYDPEAVPLEPGAGDYIDLEGADDDDSPPGTPRRGFRRTRFLGVDAGFAHPYPQEGEAAGHDVSWVDKVGGAASSTTGARSGTPAAGAPTEDAPPADAEHDQAPAPQPVAEYGMDLIDQVRRYASFCLEAVKGLEFDVVHAHDWMTYPAGLWIARATGRPLVVHVHSTEFDRSGEQVNQRVYDIERRGMHGAMRVITVSQLTKNVVVNRYGVPDSRAVVVYNGVELDTERVHLSGIRSRDRIVLYFGRITYQKGPEYFVRAAKRVLERMDDVKFVVAGSGDQARRMIEMAAEMGIGHQMLFTGFLRGDDIKRVFSIADLYVMPSISEPFGIAPLEAMGHDVPVLISRSSGVSEVLTHALKVDFWDVDDMANKIVAVLKYPPLGQTLRQHGAMEVRRLTWEGAARRCWEVYEEVAGEVIGATR
ncbi:MAG: glycosyltransferase [Planctomycetes bacterium]|nr:glycosyltransferase [Planctomycetota bacterium]